MKSLRLDGRFALVTGSTQGIGAAIAAALEESGARVFRHGKEEMVGLGDDYIAADLETLEGVEQVTEAIFQAYEPSPDILVCNAGSFFDVPFLEMDPERWAQTINLNLRASYFLIQGFARVLQKQNRPGCVVIIGSSNGFQAEAGSTAYDISRGGCVMMTRTLASELAPLGIRVNSLAPGLIRTPFTARWMDDQPELISHFNRKILLNRIGKSEDCGGGVVFLCSEAASYITGHTLVVDGGLTNNQVGRME